MSQSDFKADMANSVDQDEAAHDELPHLDLHCLWIQEFSFLANEISIFLSALKWFSLCIKYICT